jgi:hypothetical protein
MGMQDGAGAERERAAGGQVRWGEVLRFSLKG